MANSPGPLLPADEQLTHQIVDTFARVGERERSWTEKVCAMAGATDGSLQLSLGLGKYTNRGVMDAYAGISRGVEQWTVRSSRALAPDPERTAVGPIRYEVIEPLREVRFALDPNPVLPISFEWTISGPLPPAMESREVHVSRDRYRIDADIIRYHHGGTARGWVEIDGDRVDVRRRRRGCRPATTRGACATRWARRSPTSRRSSNPTGTSAYVLWFPVVLHAARRHRVRPAPLLPALRVRGLEPAHVRGRHRARGRAHASRSSTRSPTSASTTAPAASSAATITARCATGPSAVFDLEPVSDTGFHLATGLYGGFDGKYHGQWRGAEHVDGEHIPDCTTADAVPRVRQHRQALVRVEDRTDGGVGYGDLQSIVTGAHPDIGLTDGGPDAVAGAGGQAKTIGHRVGAADEARREPLGLAGDLVVREPRQQLLEHDPRLEPGQRGAEAEVLAEAEREVGRLDRADRVEAVGGRAERGLVAVARTRRASRGSRPRPPGRRRPRCRASRCGRTAGSA